jgi:hypothetical protein
MTLTLQRLEPGKSPVDMFFDRELVVTDWDAVRAAVLRGEIVSKNILAEIKQMEPLQESDPREHQHWILQQKLRLALTHEKRKPLELNFICLQCGSRKCDCYYGDRRFSNTCLHCAEESEQRVHLGSRGSCEFLRPVYNPRSRCWGITYYWNHGHSRDEAIMFWVADFYPTYRAAIAALQPIGTYHKWLEVQNNAMITEYLSFSRLIPMSAVIEMNLPMTPEQFRSFLRSAIEKDMQREQRLMAWTVSQAMDDHARSERDD